MSFMTHLECAYCGKEHDPDKLQNLCTSCQRPLWVRYDLDAIKKEFTKRTLFGRPPTIWRYMELLPVDDPAKIVSLVETITPILPVPKLASTLGVQKLMMKDESRLPTGSFKARGMAMAISKANELGVTKVAAPTAGNAGGAMAAYAARAGMEAYVFMPEDTPLINRRECVFSGAKTYLVNGLITDCGRIVNEGKEVKGWFDLSTLKEPYRIEGKKTIGLELAEQFDWELPDVILYPTGGGTGLIGMWKAFAELEALNWLKGAKKPRMIACQSQGCAPIVRAFEQGERFAKKWENAATIASGIRVPAAVGDFMILDVIRESGGTAIAVSEEDIRKWMSVAAVKEGIPVCPETAACLAGLATLLERGVVRADERILLLNTAASQKTVEAMPEPVARVDMNKPIEWDEL